MTIMIQGAMATSGTANVAGMTGGAQTQGSDSASAAGGFAALLGAIMGGQEGDATGTPASGSGLLAMLAAGMLGNGSQQAGDWTLTDTGVDEALAQLEALLKQYSAETGEDPIAALMGLPVIADWMSQVAQLRQAMSESVGDSMNRGAAMVSADSAPTDSLSKLMALVQWLDRASAAQPGNPQLQQLMSAFDKLIKPVLDHAAKAFPELQYAVSKLAGLDRPGSQDGETAMLRNGVEHQSTFKAIAAVSASAGTASQQGESAHTAHPRVSVADLQWPTAWNRHQLMQQPAQANASTAGESVMATQLTQEEAVQPVATTPEIKLAQPVEAAKPSLPVANAHQLVRDMGDLVMKQLSFQKGEGFSEARITLMPEHLGQVTIKLTMVNGQLTAQFVADTFVGRELLDSQLSQLRASLQNQGIQVEKLEVTQHSSASAFFQDQRDRDTSQRFQRPQQGKSGGYDDWDDSFDAALEETASSTWLRSGTSFEVTA